MNRLVYAAIAAITFAGCQAAPRSAQNAGESKTSTTSGTQAVTAAAPREIDVLTNQTDVWECPKCGMDYDGPGTCKMDGSTLVENRVSYICPADNKPVEHSGKCPRCAANARVEKMALATPPAGK
jgi:predicted nucleic-acid-binding Zn-ribbon protein